MLDIAVSYDGTWQNGRHTSHIGIGCAIDLLTGLPIDYDVLSNFCLKCKITSEAPSTTDEWKVVHAENCQTALEPSQAQLMPWKLRV